MNETDMNETEQKELDVVKKLYDNKKISYSTFITITELIKKKHE